MEFPRGALLHFSLERQLSCERVPTFVFYISTSRPLAWSFPTSGFLASWFCGFLASWLAGFSAIFGFWLFGFWRFGFLASWLSGFLAFWIFVLLFFLLPGFLAFWCLGFLASRLPALPGFLACWFMSFLASYFELFDFLAYHVVGLGS